MTYNPENETRYEREAVAAAITAQLNTYQSEAAHAAAQARAEEQRRAIQARQDAARRQLALRDLEAFITRAQAEEVERELATRALLASQLETARHAATASAEALARAEADWLTATTHTVTDAQLLQTLRDETPLLASKIAPLERDLAAVEERIAALSGAAEAQRRRDLAAQVWPPLVKRLAAWAREGVALLAEQKAVKDRLYAAHAWDADAGLGPGHVRAVGVDALTMSSQYGSDELAQRLAHWLAQAERAYGPLDAGDAAPQAETADTVEKPGKGKK